LREAGVPYVMSAHDYYAVCPSWNLFDYGRGGRCECPHRVPLDGPGCLPALFHEAGLPPVDFAGLRVSHRAAFDETLRGAQAVVAPAQAARTLLLSNLPLDSERVRVIAHPTDPVEGGVRAAAGERLRVALVGEIAYA